MCVEETHAHHTGNMSPGLECTAKAVLSLALRGLRQMGTSHWRWKCRLREYDLSTGINPEPGLRYFKLN